MTCGLIHAKRVRDLAIFDDRIAAETRLRDLAGPCYRGAGRKLDGAFVAALAHAIRVSGTGLAGVREGLNAIFPSQLAAGLD